MNMLLSAAAASMDGTLKGADREFVGVSTDTRTLKQDELFFALAGPNFNGSDFVSQARAKGAAGAVVESLLDQDIAQISVDDSKLALGRLGRARREQHAATVVGITGSNGKTTVKELTAACLSVASPTLATQGNLNNDIGMPLMLLRIDRKHRYAVLEMGANHVGEIGYLTSLAQPDVVAITNAGEAHLEGFGSRDGIAQGKGEILQGQPRPRCAVLNADDEYFDYWRSLVADTRVLSFGLSDDADVYGDRVSVEPGVTRFTLHAGGESVAVSLPLAGTHNVMNACAAAAIATALGLSIEDIARGLESVRPVSGRLQALPGQHGSALYDDSYNANPLSVRTAAEFLATLPGERWFVLGDMKELGEDEQHLHAEVGETLRAIGIDRLFATGDLCRAAVDAFGEGASWYGSVDALSDDVLAQLSNSTNVLVKGSRSMRMERVVDALRAPAAKRAEA